jgi:hypothetical protein
VIKFQPSTKTNSKILKGKETITGESMNIPRERRMLATTKSIIIKGTKSKKPI